MDSRWTAEHRAHVGQLVEAELDHRGWSDQTAATELAIGVGYKSIERIRKGNMGVHRETVRLVAEALGLSPSDYLPPRDVREQTQLDNIEAMLRALLAQHGIDASDILAAAADAKEKAGDDLEAKLRAEAQRTRTRPEGSP